MSSGRTPRSAGRRSLSLAVIAAGVLLLLTTPAWFLLYALSGSERADIPGTFVIVTAAGGMALVIIGAAIRD